MSFEGRAVYSSGIKYNRKIMRYEILFVARTGYKKIVAFFYHGINVDIHNEGDFIKKKHPPLLYSYEGKRISQEQENACLLLAHFLRK